MDLTNLTKTIFPSQQDDGTFGYDGKYGQFIDIIENNMSSFKKLMKLAPIENYENGPYYKFILSENLKNKLVSESLVIATSPNKKIKNNIFKIIDNAYDRLLDYFENKFYKYEDNINCSTNIDIYMNENAGFQIMLEYYIVANDKIIDQIIDEFGEKIGQNNSMATVAEDQNCEQKEQSYISSIFSYFY